MSGDRSRFSLTQLGFFNRLSARSRILVFVGAIVVFIVLIYVVTRLLFGGGPTAQSRVASGPAGLQAVPGGNLTPEYYRTLAQANAQTAHQAQITGTSAVSTMINIPGQNAGNACVVCSDQNANVKNDLDGWVQQGLVSPDVANELEQLADQNVPVSAYADKLEELVKEGKLTPAQARELLDEYQKQHENALLQDSANTMDGLVKAGQLPLDVANELLALQKAHVTPAEYAAELQRLVQEGKISPATAAQLLAQYTQQRAQEAAKDNLAALDRMVAAGQLTPDVAKQLGDLIKKNVPLSQYAAALQQLVAEGKLTPAAAAKLLEAYRQQKALTGPVGTITEFAEEAAASGDAQKAQALRDEAQRLAALQANNALLGDYADELKRAVQLGILTPAQAEQLMQEYQAATLAATSTPTAAPNTTAAFAELQQRVQQGATPNAAPTGNEFTAAQLQAEQQAAQDQQQRVEALMTAMSGQATQLVTAWQPPTMEFKGGAAAGGNGGVGAGATATSTSSSTTTSTSTTATGAPLIKAGSILFAVLDTEANSDYPNSPILATIVSGPFKGAKLLGKLVTTTGPSGQMDRISLNFTLMNMDQWATSKGINAYAIDPDTARVVMASQVNYHYMLRFGAIMATSFLQGYANAITTSGSTSTTGIFGTSSTHSNFSTGQNMAVGLGQIGQNLGTTTQNYVNIPPTVKVDSGVGLGILFMSDLS